MSDDSLLLSNQLCFLVHRLDRAIVARYKPLLAALGLTYPQYLAMLALWEHGQLSVGRLWELLDLDTGTVSPLLKRMEAAGFVERKRRADDEREVCVSLTERGTALKKRAASVPGALASCVLRGRDEYASLMATLGGLLARLSGPPC